MKITTLLVVPILVISLIVAAIPVYSANTIPMVPSSNPQERCSMASPYPGCCETGQRAGSLPASPVQPAIPAGCAPCPAAAPACPAPLPVSASPATALPATGNRLNGFRRIHAQNLMEHPERNLLYALICSNPGISPAELSRVSGINTNTLRYHIGILSRFGKIMITMNRGMARYYENHGKYSSLESVIIPYAGNTTSWGIITTILNHPGISQKVLADSAGIRGPTVHWHIRRLESEGIVVSERSGRSVRYFLSDAAQAIIENRGFGNCN